MDSTYAKNYFFCFSDRIRYILLFCDCLLALPPRSISNSMGVIIPMDQRSPYFLRAFPIAVTNSLKVSAYWPPVALATVCITNYSEIVNFHCMYDS